MKYETLLIDIADGVCTITLNRPKKKNAMSSAAPRGDDASAWGAAL